MKGSAEHGSPSHQVAAEPSHQRHTYTHQLLTLSYITAERTPPIPHIDQHRYPAGPLPLSYTNSGTLSYSLTLTTGNAQHYAKHYAHTHTATHTPTTAESHSALHTHTPHSPQTLTLSSQVFPRALSLGHEQSALGHSLNQHTATHAHQHTLTPLTRAARSLTLGYATTLAHHWHWAE